MGIHGIGRIVALVREGRSAVADRWLRAEPLPERPLVAVAAAIAAGSGMPAMLHVSPVAWWGVAAAALATWWWLPGARRPQAAALWLLAGIFAAAAGWSTVRSDLFAADDLAWNLAESARPVAIEGIVVESPRRLSPPAVDPLRGPISQAGMPWQCSECVVAVECIRDGPAWRGASGRAAVVIDDRAGAAVPDLPTGCRVRVIGRGLRPAPPLNPGEFDFRARAQSLRCLSVVRAHAGDGVQVIAGRSGWSLGAILDRLRSRGVEVLREHISPRQSALAAALLLGSRESLPREESLEFLVTGTIHILSISGLHVGLLSLALFRLFRTVALPRGLCLLAVACCAGLYMALVRAETPVVRATLLVWLGCLGAAIGRRSLAANSLAVAAIIVLVWHPPEIFRTGTQLSFLSTAVLIGVSNAMPRRATDDPIERLIDRSRPPWERRLRRMGRQAWELCLTGAAVWAVTAPIVAARFHLVSPIGLVLNPLIAPFVAAAMGWGFLCLVAATVSRGLAAVCGWACDITLRCIGAVVSWSSGLPGGYVWVSGPPGWWVAGWYVALALALCLLSRERLGRAGTWLAMGVAWCGVGLFVEGMTAMLGSGPPALRVVVAAMGHGCGIVVRSPMGRCLVYDAGRLGAAGAARRSMTAVLWQEGVGRIDTLVVSHADTDHFNAVPELLERFAVGELVVSRPFLDSDSVAVAELLRRTQAAGVPLRVVQAGDSFALDACCRLRVLHPAGPGDRPSHAAAAECMQETMHPPPSVLVASPGRSDNECSIVLAVESAGRRLLLTGDLEGEPLRRFVAAGPGACDVLVAPHHGSRTSLPPDIARVTAADWVLVSGPGTSGWDEVRKAYATARGVGRTATVLKTGCDGESGGAIAVTLTAGDVRVEQFSSRGGWRELRRAPVATLASRQTTLAGASGPPHVASQLAGSASGRVSTQPAATRSSWLATNPPSSIRTPLVKP